MSRKILAHSISKLMVLPKPGNTVRPYFKQHSLYRKIIQKDPAFYWVCVLKVDLKISHESSASRPYLNSRVQRQQGRRG